MVPHTYPTIEGRLVLGVITDITGLNEWQDYIPVVAQTNPVASSRNTFANDGYMGVNVLSSLTGLNAWIDYIPCYVVTGRSSPFSVSPDGYISVSAEVGTLGGASLADYIINSKTPDLVADFNGSLNTGTEFYDAGGTVDTFAELITHSRAGNATMTDGYGPELVTNGGFDSDSDWTKGTGWSISGGVAVAEGSTSDGRYLEQDINLVSGKTYSYEINVSGNLTGSNYLSFRFGGSSDDFTITSGSGLITGNVTASGSGNLRIRSEASLTDITIDNVSVREMPAIKWAPHNLVTYSEDFSNAVWTKENSNITANNIIAPDGTQTADRVNITAASNVYVRRFQQIDAYKQTFGIFAKAGTTSSIQLYVIQQGAAAGTADIDLSDGTVSSVAGAWTGGVTATDVGDGWYFIEGTRTFTAAASNHAVGVAASNQNGLNFYIWGAHLYRSDLGGMVDNPDRGDSYVPTASRPFGPELVTNGSFDSDSDWTKGTGATIAAGVASIDCASGVIALSQSLGVGEILVHVTITISNYVSGILRVQYGNANSPNLSANGTYSFIISPVNINQNLLISAIGGSQLVCDLDNISVRQSSVDPASTRYLPRRGHHVYNGDAWVNEGLLAESEARTNLFDYSNNANLVDGGGGNNTTISANTETDPSGTSTASLITATSVGGFFGPRYTSGTIGVIYTAWFLLKNSNSARSRIYVRNSVDGADVTINWSGTTLVSTTDTLGTSTVENFGNGYYKVSVTYVATETTQRSRFYPDNLDGDKGVVVYAWQLEAGSTPSSYIPTSGATVTRAAETLTIPAANMPWPEPNVIGDELVSNGDFSDGSTGWNLNPTQGTLEVVNGKLVATNASAFGSQAFTNLLSGYAIGTPYEISFTVSDYVSGTVQLSVGNTYSGGASSNGTFNFVVPYTSGLPRVYFNIGNTSLSIDNISVREIDPLAVSIQMQGRMTYADEDEIFQIKFLQWLEDGSNFIELSATTASTTTGRMDFRQEVGGANDFVSSGNNYFSPDILVPYNIASRHGSTFINGAVDGTALTANTTPTALPDLSTTNFSLAYDYMGTISMLRVWADDLADVGIAEATEPSEVPSLQLTFDNTETSFTIQDWEQ